MGNISMTGIIANDREGKPSPIVILERETRGRDGICCEVRIWPDGIETYRLNGSAVPRLPNLPSTRELTSVASWVKPLALLLLSLEKDSPFRNKLTNAIRDALEGA